jgi:hypothetical protein
MTNEQLDLGAPATSAAAAATAAAPAASPAEPAVDRAQVTAAIARLRAEQSLAGGLLAGVVASLAGAVIWAVVTDATGYQIGWMAIGVGFLVGIAVRTFGKGFDKVFGVLGAALALLGCVAGNLLAIVGLIAEHQHQPFMSVVQRLDVGLVGQLMGLGFRPMDLVFYGIALYEGYKLSFRRITKQDLLAAQ